MGSKVKYSCDWCGTEFLRYPSMVKGKQHLFCSRKCLGKFSNKNSNPEGYKELKDFTHIKETFSKLNAELNPKRMTPEVRKKIRDSRLGKGNGLSYAKFYGKHEHRIVAEKMLGRPLRLGEVVHHMNFNKRDNDEENLIIFPSQAEHAKYHMVLNRFVTEGIIPIDYKMKEVMPDEVHAT